jgi:hypoxanthine phosphoribosyltransferase
MDDINLNHLQNLKEQAKVVVNEHQIEEALNRLAEKLQNDYKNLNPIFLVVLNGGLVFAGQLLPKIDVLCQVDYCHATRYDGAFKGHEISWKSEPQMDLFGRHIVIVDDILDEGHTLNAIVEYCQQQKASSVKSLVLVEKLHERKSIAGQKADYCELTVPDEYVFGFGMDYSHHWRNTKQIYSKG